MVQRMRKFAMFFSGTLLVSAGLVAVACSTDNGETETPLPKADSGAKKDGAVTPPEEETDGGSTVDDSGTAADCGLAPKLRDNSTSFRCSFRSPPDGGIPASDAGNNGAFCGNNEVCCNPGGSAPFPPSFCAYETASPSTACATQATAFGSNWANGGTSWECADKNQCGTNEVCCLTTQPDAGQNVNIGNSTDKDIPKACDAKQAFKFAGTKCAATCAAGSEIKLCSLSDQNCGAGQTCTPFAALFRDLGYCK